MKSGKDPNQQEDTRNMGRRRPGSLFSLPSAFASLEIRSAGE